MLEIYLKEKRKAWEHKKQTNLIYINIITLLREEVSMDLDLDLDLDLQYSIHIFILV